MVPQPQFELEKVPETQSGTWGNLVPHMCKSHQTTSVKEKQGQQQQQQQIKSLEALLRDRA